MLPFVILGAVNAYIFLNTGKSTKVKQRNVIKVPGRGPFMVQHGAGGQRNN